MKSNSSHDLVRSASRHLENLECEFARLKFLLGELQAQSSADCGSDLVDDAERSAFNFDFHPPAGKRRPTLPDPVLLEIIARNRRKRTEHFGEGLFADPAWDMIVDLAIARARFARVSVTSLCIASGVPSTTALRWIGVLIERGVFQREDDATDRRRAFVSLTDAGIRSVANYFSEVQANSMAII